MAETRSTDVSTAGYKWAPACPVCSCCLAERLRSVSHRNSATLCLTGVRGILLAVCMRTNNVPCHATTIFLLVLSLLATRSFPSCQTFPITDDLLPVEGISFSPGLAISIGWQYPQSPGPGWLEPGGGNDSRYIPVVFP